MESPKKASPAAPDRRAQVALERRARTRAAIIDATFRAIGHEQGRLARIETVVELAKIARPTFYTYFSSMEELFAALSHELSQHFNISVLSYGKSLKDPAEEASAAIRYYLGKAAVDRKWGWGMVNLSVGGPLFGADTHAAATATVRWGMETGVFRIDDVRLGRDMVLGTGLAAMKTILTEPQTGDYPQQVARQVLLGLGVGKARVERTVTRPLPVLIQADS